MTRRVGRSSVKPYQSTSAADISAAVKVALQGRKFINESGAKLDLPGASSDYRKLFALYSGLSTLMGVAEQSSRTLKLRDGKIVEDQRR